MSTTEASEGQPSLSNKPRGKVICAVATLVFAVVAAAGAYIGVSKSSNKPDSSSSFNKAPLHTGEPSSSNQTTSPSTPKLLRSPKPSYDPTLRNATALDISPRLHSQVPSATPPFELHDVEPLESQAPSNSPDSPSTSWSDKGSKLDDQDDIALEASIFQGPIEEFISAQDLARGKSQTTTSQSNGCEYGEGRWRFELETDAYPWETSWEIAKYDDGEMIAFGPPVGHNYARRTRYLGSMCLPWGRYTMQVKDKAGDGLCCDWGQGD